MNRWATVIRRLCRLLRQGTPGSNLMMTHNDWTRFWQRRRPDLAVLGFIVFFFLCFFSWIWSSGQVLIGGDAFLYSYPLRTIFWQAVRQGSLLLWTPSVLSGYPF